MPTTQYTQTAGSCIIIIPHWIDLLLLLLNLTQDTRLCCVLYSDGVEYSTSEYEYEYRKKLRVRVRFCKLNPRRIFTVRNV